ncbi:pentapeptide repeat-containing protein [Patescibacteria group bacterium]
MTKLFSKKDYFQEKFQDLFLEKKKIKAKVFEKCEFIKCKFIDCIFDDCQFLNCNFKDCLISAAKPFNSSFLEVKFLDSKVIGFDWTKAKSILFLSFLRCNISYSNFSQLDLEELKVKECVAKEVDFVETNLKNSVFTKTDLLKTRFIQSDLSFADFRKAYNYMLDFRQNKLKKAKFSLPEASNLLRCLDIILED